MNDIEIVHSRPKKSDFKTGGISRKHLYIAAFIIILIIVGLALPFLPEKIQFAFIFIAPAVIVCVYILKNPYAGIYLYFFYEYLRPYDIIPQLGPLRLAMVIEIITLASWIMHLIRSKDKIVWTPIHTSWLALLGVIAVTVVTAVNNFYAYNVWQGMTITFIIFVIATNTVDSYNRLYKLIWLILLIHFYFAINGIINFMQSADVTGGQRTSGNVGSGFIGDENDFALSLNFMIPFAFFMIYFVKERWKKILTISILLVLVLGVTSSFSRGGWVGLIAAIIYCISFSRRKLSTFGFVIVLAIAMLLFAPDSYWKEIQTISDTKESTADARIRYWTAAVEMYKDHPIIGVGAGNGGIWLPNYITGYEFPETQWGAAFHGTLPQVMAELGTLGLGLYLFMLFYSIRLMNRIRKKEPDNEVTEFYSKSIMGSIIVYIITATFLSTAYYPQLWTIYGFTVIFAVIYGSSKKSPTELAQ